MFFSKPAKGGLHIVGFFPVLSFLQGSVAGVAFQSSESSDTLLPAADPTAELAPQPQPQSTVTHAWRVPLWEPFAVFVATLLVLAFFTPRVVAYLSPPEGDEPFYLMTAISILKDGDLNECNNYIQHDEALIYPSFYSFDGVHAYADWPADWVGWTGAPFPLPPHPGHIIPSSRQCAGKYNTYPVNYDNPNGELYSKHGLGLSVLVLPAFAVGGRLAVVFFLNLLGALLAVNIYLLARESTRKLFPALLTWLAFAFTVPLMPYSYLIFPELPAALLILYAFRRIRLMGNTRLQTLAVGLCIAALPWFHYRFAPVSVGLVLYFFFRSRATREPRRRQSWSLLMAPPVLSAVALTLFFYQRYQLPFPNPADHAGINDVAGTLRGAAGLFLDQQWGLFVAAPVFILVIVGIILMSRRGPLRRDLLWIGIVTVPYFVVIANYAQWWGEWCPPARYLAPVLPLLALPFAIVLANINSIALKAVYGVLLLLSLLTTWGFLYQPQWMYNQPNGKSLLLLQGLPELGSLLHLRSLTNLDATRFFPSFVAPYFAYLRGKAPGDIAATAAWRASIAPSLFIVAVVTLCLVLAYFNRHHDDASVTGDTAGSPDRNVGDPGPPRLDGPSPVVTSISSFRRRLIAHCRADWLGAAALFNLLAICAAHIVSLLVPAFAPRRAFALVPAGLPLGSVRFQTTSSDPAGQHRALPPPNGSHDGTGVAPENPRTGNGVEAHTELSALTAEATPAIGSAVAVSAPVVNAKRRALREIVLTNVLWRTRALWLGLVAVGIAMYAQKLTTVDRLIQFSIRWYALAIALMLVGWLGTYKNRSFLVMPIRGPKKAKASTPPASVEALSAPITDSAISPGNDAQAVDGTTESRSPGSTAPALDMMVAPEIGSPLPMRKRTSGGATSYILPTPDAPAAGNSTVLLTTSLPVRTRSSDGVTTRISGLQPSTSVASEPAIDTVPDSPDGSTALPPSAATPPADLQAGTHRANTPVAVWKRFAVRFPGVSSMWWRYTLAFIALGINLYSAGQIRHDYYSIVGTWGWIFSLALLLLAFLGERRKCVQDVDTHTDVIEQTDTRISRKVEVAVVLIIFLLGLGLRLLNLGDITAGMHGDEGEAGMDAISILEGNRVSPFLTGWFAQPNFYYWGIALTMKVFGTDLFGLRMFSTLFGSLLIVPFYGLVRMWFGVRTAIIAGLLLAISDVAIHFSRAEFSNITTPVCLTIGFYFLFRGLRSKRTLDFVLSGYGFMLSLYFYMGARLTPFIVLAVLGYLFLLMPLVRLPGAYGAWRKLMPGAGRLRALGSAIFAQGHSVSHYFGQVLVLIIACVCFASPWTVYYLDNQGMLNARTNEKLIFTNEGRMAQQYSVAHAPLYVGIRMPTEADIYPFLPVVFEQTPVSVQVSQDGFWPHVLWNQLTMTLSMFTYRFDASSVYTFTNEPVSKPIEAALLILGVAWALWRWRDTRMATVSIWFWSTVLVGGVLTIDAPYMARIVGVIPAVAILTALPLTKLLAELTRFVSIVACKIKAGRPRRVFSVSSRAFSASVVGALLLYLALQNYSDYSLHYTKIYAFTDVTGQAYFVRQMNDKVKAEGRPLPRYYDLGIHFIFWGHGDNRFLNHGTPGGDMVNATNDLPVTENEDRDVVFMIWPYTQHYLNTIKAYYPDGEYAPFSYGPPNVGSNLFSYYRVTRQQIDDRRQTVATYTPLKGAAIQRQEQNFGSISAPPPGLSYPVEGSWAGSIVAPAFGRYRFSLDSPGAGSVVIDGTPVLTTTAEADHAVGELLLARGPHETTLMGSLADAGSKVTLEWAVGGQEFSAIPRKYIWGGPGHALLGQISAYIPDLMTPQAAPQGVISTRIDGFLGFRHAPEALTGGPLTGIWTGTLDIKTEGSYSFDVNSNGDSIILIDNNLVVNNIRGGSDAHTASGQVDLTVGPHTFELRYNWTGGVGYLEAFWTPPNAVRTMLGPDALHTSGGIVDPSKLLSEPPPVQIEPDAPPVPLQPGNTISGEWARARGLAVDKQGNIYVGDRGNHQIVVYSPDGKVIHTWGKAAPVPKEGEAPPPAPPGAFGEILDVAVGDDGTVYVLDDLGRAQAFSPAGDFKQSIEPAQLGLYAPNGIGSAPPAAGAAGGQDAGMVIAVTGQGRILRLPSFDALKSGKVTVEAGSESITVSEGDALEQPVDVVADPSGSGLIYAIDLKDRIVQLKAQEGAGPNGQRTWTISKQWHVLVGRDDGGSRLAISSDGKHVYMSDPDRKRVAALDVTKGKITVFGSEGRESGKFAAPSGIGVGPDGRVYVLDKINNNIQIFDLNDQK